MKRGFIFILFLTLLFQANGQSTGKYQIKFLELNKNNSDYGVAILDENKLVFTSAGQKVSSVSKNYNPRKDLYVGDIDFDGEVKNVKRITKEVDKKFNQTGAAYSADKKTVYFSRNKYWKKLKKQNLPKNKRLILYKADVDSDGNWKNIKKLPFNKKNTSTGYPVLNVEGDKLYFVSDRLPSKGRSDIFVVDILEDGSYSQPKNLGKNVNTGGNETTPFIAKDNILYFSSDGHSKEGKLDVYAVEIYDNTTSEAYRLASPINSINDDFAYIVNEDNNQGFFTSNRLQGKGFNDLYSFTLEEDTRPGECFISVDGRVIDKDTYHSIAGATVDLYSLDGSLIESVSTYDDGTYKFTVSCAKEYELVASNPEYLDDKKRIEILEENYHSALHTNLNLSRIAKKKPVLKSLSPIYYEFDDATITQDAAKEMDRIVDIMNQNQNLIIEASSFTDSRGSDNYNVELSKRRAKAAVEYFKSQGIDAKRIKSKGYGENKLINQCVNGAECNDEAHQMNRRTEFNFVNIPGVSKKKSSSTEVKVAEKVPKPEPVPKKAVRPKEKAKQMAVAEVKATQLKTDKIDKEDLAEIEIVEVQKKQIVEEPKLEAKEIIEVEPIKVVALNKEEVKFEEPKEKKIILKKKEDQIANAKIENKEIKSEKIVVNENANQELSASQSEEEAVSKKVVKEEVIINYNSTIVATNPESNKVLNYIGTEKIKMIDQLSELERKYEEAIPNYPRVSDSLKMEKGKIVEVISKAKDLEETGWSNIIEYKNDLLHFKKRYRDLMVENSRNSTAGSSTRRERQIAHQPNYPEAIVETKSEAAAENKVVEMEENLSVDNIMITAMKKNGQGKYQKTSNANKTDLIKVSFKLVHNNRVNSGQKEAHVILQNPEGEVEEAKGIFQLKDSETEFKYTDHAIINYNNHDVDVTMFIQRRGNNFEKGVYPVKLFLEGELMAVTKLQLQNPY